MNTTKTRKMLRSLSLSSLTLIFFLTSCSGIFTAPSPEQAPIASESISSIIAKYREEIPQQLRQRNIPGLAIAVVDDQGILWAEGFGTTERGGSTPVTPATIFSIQSMSKSFTATAAMIAAQEGLVDLDAPITTYLPDFTVHSIFEDHPEQKMTMRTLLSHTAGFPHDPGYGGNNDGPFGTPPYSFEKHIASISDTWLMFPVGTHYSYSNIGIDLAGYILQVRSGTPFVQYVQEKVFNPLGMKGSTLDYRRVRADATRAFGHTDIPLRLPIDFQLLPSGGVWTSAEDMARYLQFHINKGALDGNRLLREDLAETMYTPPNMPALGAYGDTSYALGITVDNRNNTRHFQHGGGGFGFNSSMVWYPDLKLGSVVLSNYPQPDAYVAPLSESVLESIMMSNIPLYHKRSINAAQAAPAYAMDREGEELPDSALRDLIASKALPENTAPDQAAAMQRRSAAVGTYLTTYWGFPAETIEIDETDRKLNWSYQGGMMINAKAILTEVQPGLFFSPDGNLIDLRGPAKMIDNIRLIKENPGVRAFRLAVNVLCGLIFLSALFFWPARALVSRLRGKKRTNEPAPRSSQSHWLVWAGILAALTSLAGLLCIGVMALIPNLLYVPWPRPFIDLTWWQFALVGMPFASLVVAVGVVLLAALALRGARESRSWYYLAVGLALTAFNLILIV